MKQNNPKKLPLALLNAALVLQIIYLVGTFSVVMAPEFYIRAYVADYSGGYQMPFDSIHFGAAILTTLIFSAMYILLMLSIKKGKQLGMGFGILLGVMAYLSYFIATSGVANLASLWVEQIGENTDLIAGWTMSWEENLAMYYIVVANHEIMRLALKTAIILVFVAFGVYAMRSREQNPPMPKKLYK